MYDAHEIGQKWNFLRKNYKRFFSMVYDQFINNQNVKMFYRVSKKLTFVQNFANFCIF